MKNVPLNAVQFDPSTQIRAEIDTDTIDDYAEAMEAGAQFPAADLFVSGTGTDAEYFIGDGWHRLLASMKNGDATVRANVHEGGRAQAIKFALSANATNGRRRTNEDKRRAVEVALKEYPNLSSRKIAEMCAVSHDFAERVRKQQLSSDDSSTGRQLSSDDSSRTRIGADGKERKLPERQKVDSENEAQKAWDEEDEKAAGGVPAPAEGEPMEVHSAPPAPINYLPAGKAPFNAEAWKARATAQIAAWLAEVPARHRSAAVEFICTAAQSATEAAV